MHDCWTARSCRPGGGCCAPTRASRRSWTWSWSALTASSSPRTRCCCSSPTRPTGRLRMSELADSVLLSRSGLTRLVDRLERQGLLRRESCEKDGRGAYAVITPRGRSLFDRARVTHLDGVREAFLAAFHPEPSCAAGRGVAANDRRSRPAARPRAAQEIGARPSSAAYAGAPRGWRAPAGSPPRPAPRGRAAGTRGEATSVSAARR